MRRAVLRSIVTCVIAVSVLPYAHPAAQPVAHPEFVVEEATIAQVHAAMHAGVLTCRHLVDHYLERIAAYDRRGPALNALVAINPDAAREADRLDARFADGGFAGPLHCVPVVVKDNIGTAGLQTAAGSLSLKGFMPERDATAVTKLKAAGAIILAKTNMAEFGLNPLTTINSLQGATKNPYALDRVPAGSSGGTAVSVAANFALVGLGTDTGSSVRGPAAHNSIVGLRPTMGLTSRAGMIPLNYLSDVIGPMARTVEDAAAVLEVLAGWDPDDPVTEAVRGAETPAYLDALVLDPLAGVRLGVLRQAYQGGALRIDAEIAKVFTRALKDLESLGAVVVDPVLVEQVRPVPGAESCRGLKYDLNEYLAKQGARVPVHNLAEIISSGRFHRSIEEELVDAQDSIQEGPGSRSCRANDAYRSAFAAAVTTAMDRNRVDALIYPTWSQPPQLATSVSPQQAGQALMFATASGFPAVTVPMGFTREVLPSGLSFLGRAWSEASLLRLAYAYEQATRHRRPSVLTPPIH